MALVGDQSRSGPDQEELQAQENGTNRSFEQTLRLSLTLVGRQSGSDGKGDVEELSIPETRSRARTQTGLFVCIEYFVSIHLFHRYWCISTRFSGTWQREVQVWSSR